MNTGKIIAIVGAQRSGKTFLAKKLAEYFSANLFLEDNGIDFPESIKEDIEKNIRPLERILWFRNVSVKQYLIAQKLKKEGKSSILDTFYMKPYYPLITKDFEFELCEELLSIDNEILDKPDLVIFLKNNIQKTKEFIKKGNRKFDSALDFYEKNIIPVQKEYEKMFNIKNYHGNLIVIDRSDFDFENNKCFEDLIKGIKECLNK